MSVLWYFIFVLACISLMTYNVKHLFIYLFCHLDIFFGEVSVKVFNVWLLVSLLLSFKRFCTFWTKILYQNWFLQIFFSSLWLIFFHSFDIIFHISQAFILIKFSLSILSFMDCAFGAFLPKCIIWRGRENSNLRVDNLQIFYLKWKIKVNIKDYNSCWFIMCLWNNEVEMTFYVCFHLPQNI